MRQMKDSGIEWIGKIPQDWDKKPIKRLLESRNSGAWGKEPNPEEGIDKVCIRVADFNFEKQIINTDNLTIRNYDKNTIKKIELQKGDILIEKSGGGEVTPVGRSVIFSLDSSCLYANFIDCLRCDKENEPKYIVLLLKALYHYGLIPSFIKQTTGIQNLDFPNLSQSNIFVPKKTVQQQIADYLDKKCSEIDTCLTDVNESIAKLQEYKKSIITEAVTKGLDPNTEMKDSGIEWIGEIPKNWTVSKLKYLGQAIIGLTYSPDNIDDEGFLVLRSSNIQEGKLSLNDTVIVNKEIPKKLIIKKDDLLICSRNGSKSLIGKTIMIKDNLESTTFGAFMTVFRSDYNSFIYYVLQSEIFNYHIETFLTSTINQLTTGNLNGIKITLPRETAEQQQIADYLDNKCAEIDNVIEDKKELAKKLKEYKNSLIYECVTGKREVG